MIDTNVILDVLLNREPFFQHSAQVLDRAEKGEYTGLICATTVTTLFYLARRELGTEQAIEKLRDLIAIFSIASVNRSVIEAALAEPTSDFEDSVLNQAAITSGADCIVTRNEADFSGSSLMVYSPAQFLASLI